jgi:ribosomal protein S18 acetylase RimI-like enzyme
MSLGTGESMHYTVRQATENDLTQMTRLWREMMDFHSDVEPRFRPLPPPAGEEAWVEHMRKDVLGNESCCVFLAETDEGAVGQMIGLLRDEYAVFEPGQFGYVTDVAVDPAVRRSGVGRALFEALKAWFRERGVTHLRMMVAHCNPVSQPFWRALGCTDYMDILWYDLSEGQ